ncbi:type II toxin-antitoxin system Phd/YefM family antitoxin [Nonomuraea typhae]|uniref:Antitoxin n=1 Tax=Nonomuraea typhae TaxID=2603600 RepID=A0ABW7YZB5_9ACTN
MTDHARRITQRELRNDSGEILRAVEHGETFTVTRNGTPVARLVPLNRQTFVSRALFAATSAQAPAVDLARFRADQEESLETAWDDPFER